VAWTTITSQEHRGGKLVARNTVSDIRWGSLLDWPDTFWGGGVPVWEYCSEMTPRMYDNGNAFFICTTTVTSIFKMSLAPLNFENHFFFFDSGLQKSLLLNTNRSKSLENLIRYN